MTDTAGRRLLETDPQDDKCGRKQIVRVHHASCLDKILGWENLQFVVFLSIIIASIRIENDLIVVRLVHVLKRWHRRVWVVLVCETTPADQQKLCLEIVRFLDIQRKTSFPE